jgi:ATP-dependent helicase/nuclease subunit B
MPRRSRSNVPGDSEPDLFAGSEVDGTVVRRFLGWDQPFVRSVVEHLTRGWARQGALDLTEVLVVVPTRNAGRRLREALAMHAAAFEAVVLPPLVVTPDFLTSPERLPDVPVAGRVETLLIWAGELMRLDLEQHRRLFPADPVERSFTWALKVAGDLLELRETLNENGLSLVEAARVLRGSEMEPERWEDLARLEQRCLKETEERHLADWQTMRRRVAAQAEPPAGVSRVVMAGVLDPSGLAIEALQGWVRILPVEVLVFAPETSHAEAFDAWGRPMPDSWQDRSIDIPSPSGTIHVGRTPGEQADVAVKRLSEHAHPEEVAAMGVADSEVTVPLEKALERSGMGAFDPAGKRMGTHGVLHLLRVLAQLALTRSFQSVAELLRCSDVTDAVSRHVERQTGQWPSLRLLLDDLDSLAAAALPDTLGDAIELAPMALQKGDNISPVLAALDWVHGVLVALESDHFGEALTTFLGEVFESRRFRTDSPGDAVFAAIADQILVTLDALDGPATRGFPGGMDASQRLELLLQVLADQAFYSERKAGDIDLQGWLELLWEDAPHVVVTGMNDGKAPESILGHTFLPDSARRVLGLRVVRAAGSTLSSARPTPPAIRCGPPGCFYSVGKPSCQSAPCSCLRNRCIMPIRCRGRCRGRCAPLRWQRRRGSFRSSA